MFNKPHAHQNQKSVLGSAILAKAVTRLNNGRYEIMIVFALSTRIEFFWLFQARSPRSPQRSWKFVGYAPRDLPQHYFDFSSFVSHHANLHGGQMISVRMPRRRQLAALQNKTAHDSIHSDWSPVPSCDLTRDARKLYKRLRKASYGPRARRSAWAS